MLWPHACDCAPAERACGVANARAWGAAGEGGVRDERTHDDYDDRALERKARRPPPKQTRTQIPTLRKPPKQVTIMRRPRSHPFAPSAGRAFAARSAYNSARTKPASLFSVSILAPCCAAPSPNTPSWRRSLTCSARCAPPQRNTPYKSARSQPGHPTTAVSKAALRFSTHTGKRSLCSARAFLCHNTPPSLSLSIGFKPLQNGARHAHGRVCGHRGAVRGFPGGRPE